MNIGEAKIRGVVRYGKSLGIIDDIDYEDNTVRVSFNETDFQWVDISELKRRG